MTFCDSCGSPIFLDPRRGEAVCSGCSLVADMQVFEERPLTADTELVGLNTGIPVTKIVNEMRDAGGRAINNETRSKMKRLSWVDSHSPDKRNRSIKKLFAQVETAGQRLDVTKVVRERAFYIAKRAYDKHTLCNQDFLLLTGGAFMLAAQETGVCLMFKDLVRVLSISRAKPEKQLRRAYRIMKRALKMYQTTDSPETLISFATSKLGLPPNVNSEAKRIYESFSRYRMMRADVAVAIFVAAHKKGKPKPQVHVASALGVSDMILRSRLNESFPELLNKKRN